MKPAVWPRLPHTCTIGNAVSVCDCIALFNCVHSVPLLAGEPLGREYSSDRSVSAMHACMMTKAGSARDRHPSASVSVKALSFCGHELPLELLLLSAHQHFCHQCCSHQHHVPALVPAHPRRCSRIATGHPEQLRSAAYWHACSSAENKHLTATQLQAQHSSFATGWPSAAVSLSLVLRPETALLLDSPRWEVATKL
jgi:hypothetical protein